LTGYRQVQSALASGLLERDGGDSLGRACSSPRPSSAPRRDNMPILIDRIERAGPMITRVVDVTAWCTA